MKQDISEVAVEINSIFDNMSEDILNKIPLKIKNFFKEIASKTYTFTYDTTKSLNEQNIMDKTRGIIALLYRDYICDENEKKEYNDLYFKYLKEKEDEKRNRYNPDITFKNKVYEIKKSNNNALKVIDNKKNIIKTIFDKILNFFKGKIGTKKK